jgi:hypothetical protein
LSSELYRMMPSRPTTLSSDLWKEQTTLLWEIAIPFATTGEWPTWDYVTRRMRQHKIDARKTLASLPRIGAQGPAGASYGFTGGATTRGLSERDKVQLTVAAALPLGELRPILAEPFLRVLHHMITLQCSVVPSPTEVTEVWLDSKELAAAIPGLKPEFIASLPEVFAGEPGTWGGSQQGPNPPHDLSWRKGIRPEIEEYTDVKDLETYIAKVCEITTALARENDYQHYPVGGLAASAPAVTDSTPSNILPTHGRVVIAPTDDPVAAEAPAPAAPVYAKAELIAEFEQLDGAGGLHTDKLVGLLNELNFNFAHGKPLACSGLLRAVLDHVPPGFGFPVGTGFATVVAQGCWGRTDKNYLKRLAEFRDQGDDVLHRQMDQRRSRIDMDGMPAPAALNAMLDGLVVKLKAATAAAGKP